MQSTKNKVKSLRNMMTKFRLNGAALKWMAIAIMAIDHLGAVILEAYVLNAWGGSPLGDRFAEKWHEIYQFDLLLRNIGRLAFPMFCFLLVEGFVHTRNIKKYAISLGIFALLSEIPFDLALHIMPFYWSHQNVYFTLLLGILTLCVMHRYEQILLIQIAAAAAGAALAELLHVDYGAFGVLLIVVLYVLRRWRPLQCITGAICCAWEHTAVLAFLLIFFYNGIRGRQPKWFFYWFYPVHLLLYTLIGMYVLPAIYL